MISTPDSFSSLPLRREIPGSILAGGKEFGSRSPKEWLDSTAAYPSPQGIFPMILDWGGVDGVSIPLPPGEMMLEG